MEIGIIGLPRSGKTTIFNAVSKGNATVAGYSNKPNLGVAKVPDVRLDRLVVMFNPRRVVPAEVIYVDIPPPPDSNGKTRSISGEYLNALQGTDALLIVARAFEDPSVTHVDGTIDALRDVYNLLLELTFNDIGLIDRRHARIDDNLKGAKVPERDLLTKERTLLARIKRQLEDGVALRDQGLTADEARHVQGFQFLTGKPIIIIINVGENQISETAALERQLETAAFGSYSRTTVTCGQLEMELSQMDAEEEREFRDGLVAGESGLDKMIRLSYDVIGQISFFTVGDDEVRAWEIRANTIAQKAAGKIHTDLERGFIRAEVVAYNDLVECGNLGEARKRGVLRQQGKEYVVKDGDIMDVLFNV